MGGDPQPISSSRAFWEMKAEQVMDRVFSTCLPSLGLRPGERPSLEGYVRDPNLSEPSLGIGAAGEPDPIDVVVHDEPPRLPAGDWTTRHRGRATRPRPVASTPPAGSRSRLGHPQQRSVVALMTVLSLMGVGSTVLVWRGWTQASIALQQERTLQLLERLRSVGPLAEAEPGATAASTARPAAAGLEGSEAGLPPPPPEEAWVEELAPLESSSRASAAPPLRVPVSGTITRAAPPAPAMPAPQAAGGPAIASASAGSSNGTPELVGVVQVPGQSGSAIFQMGGSSTSASVGEAIGSTGWRLRSASGNSVVIERNGQQQRVSITGGF